MGGGKYIVLENQLGFFVFKGSRFFIIFTIAQFVFGLGEKFVLAILAKVIISKKPDNSKFFLQFMASKFQRKGRKTAVSNSISVNNFNSGSIIEDGRLPANLLNFSVFKTLRASP